MTYWRWCDTTFIDETPVGLPTDAISSNLLAASPSTVKPMRSLIGMIGRNHTKVSDHRI